MRGRKRRQHPCRPFGRGRKGSKLLPVERLLSIHNRKRKGKMISTATFRRADLPGGRKKSVSERPCSRRRRSSCKERKKREEPAALGFGNRSRGKNTDDDCGFTVSDYDPERKARPMRRPLRCRSKGKGGPFSNRDDGMMDRKNDGRIVFCYLVARKKKGGKGWEKKIDGLGDPEREGCKGRITPAGSPSLP